MRPTLTLTILILFLLSSCDHKTKSRVNLQNDHYIDSVFLSDKKKIMQTQKKINDSLQSINKVIQHLYTSKDKKPVINKKIKLLKQNQYLLIKELNKLRKQSFAYFNPFPTKDIKNCLNDTIERKHFINHRSCLKCDRKSEDLLWIQFKSPDYTWKNLMGIEGSLSICEKCGIPVEFITAKMN